MVKEASAILVATTTFLFPGGAGSNIRDCISLGRALYTDSPTPLNSCAKCLSPASGIGSSQGRFRSLGIESSIVLCCWSRTSLLSLISADCNAAARLNEPSGFLKIFTGDMSTEYRLCPCKNSGSSSFSSISSSSSPPSSRFNNPSPSSSKEGKSFKLITPAAISCLASHLSGELILFKGLLDGTDSSSSVILIPDSPILVTGPPPFAPDGFTLLSSSSVLLFKGNKSFPVC
ncbi:hypothetical protein Leryth_010292 [Lithospermum erythrorhizon]|nr:hypothetical protein Leryth_010292 [Lithospermum erythrorhizon]